MHPPGAPRLVWASVQLQDYAVRRATSSDARNYLVSWAGYLYSHWMVTRHFTASTGQGPWFGDAYSYLQVLIFLLVSLSPVPLTAPALGVLAGESEVVTLRSCAHLIGARAAPARVASRAHVARPTASATTSLLTVVPFIRFTSPGENTFLVSTRSLNASALHFALLFMTGRGRSVAAQTKGES